MRIALIGANGQIGFELASRLVCRPDVQCTALDRTQLDLTDENALRNAVRDLKPDIVINAAAYTAVDRAETEPELVHAVNAHAPAVLAQECKRHSALLVHYSTDYVFDGAKRLPYSEEDAKHPLNVYGKTKHAADMAIEQSGCRYLILRVSWIYSNRGENFFLKILHRAAEGKLLRVVHDQWGSPTSSILIAKVTERLLFQELEGVYHCSASGSATWFQFAAAILEGAGISTAVTPVASAEYPTRAQRPFYSVLSTKKLHSAIDVELPDWRRCLKEVLEQAEGASVHEKSFPIS